MRALHHACSCSHESCIALLLDRGADANAVDEYGEYFGLRSVLHMRSELSQGLDILLMPTTVLFVHKLRSVVRFATLCRMIIGKTVSGRNASCCHCSDNF